MISRVGWVRVFVSDMDRAVDFYENQVGVPVRARSPDFPQFVELATEGTVLALHRPGDEWPEGKKQVGRPTGITLMTADIQATYRSLTSKGVRFSGPPARQPWGGILASFFDLDGNEIDLTGWAGG